MIWIQQFYATTLLFIFAAFLKSILSDLNLPNTDDDGYGNGAGT